MTRRARRALSRNVRNLKWQTGRRPGNLPTMLLEAAGSLPGSQSTICLRAGDISASGGE
jgi:hypothetical protein